MKERKKRYRHRKTTVRGVKPFCWFFILFCFLFCLFCFIWGLTWWWWLLLWYSSSRSFAIREKRCFDRCRGKRDRARLNTTVLWTALCCFVIYFTACIIIYTRKSWIMTNEREWRGKKMRWQKKKDQFFVFFFSFFFYFDSDALWMDLCLFGCSMEYPVAIIESIIIL